MKICWATDYEGIGNSYGYSVHNARTREALRATGVEFDRRADIAVHVAPAHLFNPIEGRINVLYTAWEMEVLPPLYVEQMAKADAIVVSASYLVKVVKGYLPEKPVYLCWEGVDVDTYTFRLRQKPLGRPFRFLWVGAPNARKGWELITAAFGPFMGDRRFELYLKTTVTDKIVRRKNIIFDSRRLTTEQLADLYHSAHCFLFPSFGEGFGLTMAEAMATGLPVIYTPWSSLTDLAPTDSRCGYPVKYRMIAVQVQDTGGLVSAKDTPVERAVPARLAQADTADLARKMVQVWRHYASALKRGRRAAERIRNRFTWAHTGRTMARILKEVKKPCRQVEICAA